MKPILFNTEMVKAILDGRKTQTRRIVPFKIYTDENGTITAYSDVKNMRSRKGTIDSVLKKTKYKVGDILWVRESVIITNISDVGNYGGSWQDDVYIDFKYIADKKDKYSFVLPSKCWGKSWVKVGNKIPNGCLKEMARIFLEVTDVRVEQLHDISIDSIAKEGYPEKNIITALDGYKWKDNPYVFVYEFRVLEGGTQPTKGDLYARKDIAIGAGSKRGKKQT